MHLILMEMSSLMNFVRHIMAAPREALLFLIHLRLPIQWFLMVTAIVHHHQWDLGLLSIQLPALFRELRQQQVLLLLQFV